jgi:hypothetical protein
LKLETSCNNCSVDIDAIGIPPVTTASDVRMLGSRRWKNDEFFSARAVESSLQYSVMELFLEAKGCVSLDQRYRGGRKLKNGGVLAVSG